MARTSAFSACVGVTAAVGGGSGAPLVQWVSQACPHAYDPLQRDTGGVGSDG